MPVASISVIFNQTSSFSSWAPVQRTAIIDTTNPVYPRYSLLSTGAVTLVYQSQSVVIPLANLYAAAVSAYPILSWPPVIGVQPTSSAVTHSNAVYFRVSSSSSETAVTYQWFYNTGSNSNYFPIAASDPVNWKNYTGSLTPALTSSVTTLLSQSNANYLCVLTNSSGQTTSSIANLIVV